MKWSLFSQRYPYKKFVKLHAAGELQKHLTNEDISSLMELVIEGKIDARDFSSLRKLKNLVRINLCNASIKPYHEHLVNEVPKNAFAGCRMLEEVTLPDDVETISDQAFFRCKNLTYVHLPIFLMRIGYRSFYECSRLESIILPPKLVHLGSEAFSGCKKLQKIQINAHKLILLEECRDVFHKVCPNNCYIYTRKGSKELYKDAHQWSKFNNIIEFNDFKQLMH